MGICFLLFLDHLHSSSLFQPLKNKINTVPELITGPIAAEKKRSELLNAIKLGKRPRSDYQEHEGKISLIVPFGIMYALYFTPPF